MGKIIILAVTTLTCALFTSEAPNSPLIREERAGDDTSNFCHRAKVEEDIGFD